MVAFATNFNHNDDAGIFGRWYAFATNFGHNEDAGAVGWWYAFATNFNQNSIISTGPQGTQGPKLGYNPEKRGEVAKWENGVTGYQKMEQNFGKYKGETFDRFEISRF